MPETAGKTLQAEAGLGLNSVEAFRSKAREILEDHDLVVDFSKLKDADSSVLACLFDLRRFAHGVGRTIEFRSMPDALLKLAEVYDVVGLLPQQSKQG